MKYLRKKFSIYMGCDREQARKNYDNIFGKRKIDFQKILRIILAIVFIVLLVLIMTWGM